MMGCSGCNDTGGASYNGHYVNGPARELHRQRAKGARAVADQINLRCKSRGGPAAVRPPHHPQR